MHDVISAIGAVAHSGDRINISLSIRAAVAVVSGLAFWLAPVSERPRKLLEWTFAASAFAIMFNV